jgi:TRAP transporter TAXI family solute receptor
VYFTSSFIVIYKRLSFIAFVVLFIFLTFQLKTAFCTENSHNLNLATGNEKGVYFPIGKGIAEVVKKINITINVLPSAGSIENINRLSQGKAELCLAQKDVVYNAYNGLGNFDKKISEIRVIASLYSEAVHVLIRKPLYIKDIEDFKGKRISVGKKGSGTEANANAVLEISGITKREYELQNLSFDETIEAFRKNSVDIAFITCGIPSEAVKDILEENIAYIYEINYMILNRLLENYPSYNIITIIPDTYKNQIKGITTIGVSALLIGREDLDEDLVYELTKAIFNNTETFKKHHKAGANISLETALKGVKKDIPILIGAKRFYEEEDLLDSTSDYIVKFLHYVSGAIISFIVILIIVYKFNNIRLFFRKREFARMLVALMFVWIAGSVILYYVEPKKINPNYHTLPSSLWTGLTNMIIFGGRKIFTVPGKATVTIMKLFGIGGVTWFSGIISSVLIDKKTLGGKKGMNKIKDHYVIVNWNEKGFGIIEQLHSPVFVDKRPIIIISDSESALTFPEENKYDGIYTIQGNPTSEMILKRADVHCAHSIIILADQYKYIGGEKGLQSNSNNQAADAKSILSILAIRKICKEANGKPIPIIVEILDPQKIELATYAGVEENGNVEIVSSRKLEQGLLSQAAVNPGLTKIYKNLLTFGEAGSEIYKSKIPAGLINKPINEAFKMILDLRDNGINIIPIGVSRNGKNYLNPTKEKIERLKEGDSLFVICYNEKELKRFENKVL